MINDNKTIKKKKKKKKNHNKRKPKTPELLLSIVHAYTHK
jgi:hypothetical protein